MINPGDDLTHRWRHLNGNLYAVLRVVNLPDDRRYPKMVIYQNDQNGTEWARRYDEWHRSFTLVEPLILHHTGPAPFDPSDALDDANCRYGEYVNDSPYKLMRLRILLTGTSGPTEAEFSAGLTRLLDHLELHPLPEA